MTTMTDFVMETVFPILLIVFFTVAIIMLGHYFGPTGCDARWDGFDVNWSLQGGCKVLTDSGYVPEGSFRVVTTP